MIIRKASSSGFLASFFQALNNSFRDSSLRIFQGSFIPTDLFLSLSRESNRISFQNSFRLSVFRWCSQSPSWDVSWSSSCIFPKETFVIFRSRFISRSPQEFLAEYLPDVAVDFLLEFFSRYLLKIFSDSCRCFFWDFPRRSPRVSPEFQQKLFLGVLLAQGFLKEFVNECSAGVPLRISSKAFPVISPGNFRELSFGVSPRIPTGVSPNESCPEILGITSWICLKVAPEVRVGIFSRIFFFNDQYQYQKHTEFPVRNS